VACLFHVWIKFLSKFGLNFKRKEKKMETETKLKAGLVDNFFDSQDETRLNTSQEILMAISAITENKEQAERMWDDLTESEFNQVLRLANLIAEEYPLFWGETTIR
jgi:hypothetical protein